MTSTRAMTRKKALADRYGCLFGTIEPWVAFREEDEDIVIFAVSVFFSALCALHAYSWMDLFKNALLHMPLRASNWEAMRQNARLDYLIAWSREVKLHGAQPHHVTIHGSSYTTQLKSQRPEFGHSCAYNVA